MSYTYKGLKARPGKKRERERGRERERRKGEL